jgi:hypothetical protein
VDEPELWPLSDFRGGRDVDIADAQFHLIPQPVDHKDKRDKNRRAGLRELSQVTQEFGGYTSELKQ